MSKRMSRENQKLIYWFIDCYAYKLKGVDINWQTSKQKPAISDYFLYKAKEDLKKLHAGEILLSSQDIFIVDMREVKEKDKVKYYILKVQEVKRLENIKIY